MRVLVIPEVYRHDDLSSNGTVNDAVSWADHWLRRDPTLHVYWLLPPPATVPYDPADVLADRHRVTLIEAEQPLSGPKFEDHFTENGYSAEQLSALQEHIFEPDAYVDVVVDQLRTGRFTLYKWLLDHVDQWAARVRPFDVIVNVHDLQVPFKYQGCTYRNAYQMFMELSGITFADGRWFTAGIDAANFRQHASRVFRRDVVEDALDDAVVTGSPIAFDRFDEQFRDKPETLHLAGSLAEKKHADALVEVSGRLFDRFGIGTVMTSMDAIPDAYRDVEWIDTRPRATRSVYEQTLERGDVAVCASEYETMARTPFEQAASGQVLILRDEPWIYDCIPDGYPFVGEVDALADLAIQAVEAWDRAVAANEELVAHVTEVRHPTRCGRRTYDDLERRVREKQDRYTDRHDGNTVRGKLGDVVSRAVDDMDDPEPALDEIIEQTGRFTDDGRPVTERPSYAVIDLVHTLRVVGYGDTGEPGTPAFRRRIGADQ